jgi:hypothetical protein
MTSALTGFIRGTCAAACCSLFAVLPAVADDELADAYAFLVDQLGMKPVSSPKR